MDKELESNISYILCYALRHEPWKFKLHLDDNGFCEISDLLESLNIYYANITISDIEYIVKNDKKGKFQIREGRIRAVYGHSFERRIIYDEIIPPNILYHGTTLEVYNEFISKEGLKHQKRQYVHLSSTVETALMVARRRKNKTHIILEIDTLEAYAEGVKFYKANEDIYLSTNIPAKYLKIKKI
ncbi:RNA 2'-phosphotransferase [uncultured Clostridium sp.]|uniref:RNA 2'-phosphotransferase n=1 Tax=uncultured Clostridium sp. TaxID=59620 RepID=UPI0008226E83|nr:RNA 2'-phosphotransferase [uncultured Clostridium sp.]SCJ93320.1 RNA 2'-phosphotransferase [uncultured Clostridium sp.]